MTRLKTPARGTPPRTQESFLDLLGIGKGLFAKVVREIQAGLPFQTLEHFQQKTALSTQEVCDVVQIPARTLHRRKLEGQLQPDESDRLARAARVFALALALFEGDRDSTHRWLTTPQRALGGATPLKVANTDVGVKEIENLILRTEHGVFS